MPVYKVKYTYEVEIEAEDEYLASKEAEKKLSENMDINYIPEIFNENIEKIEKDEVTCNLCGWRGKEDELILFEDKEGYGDGCPYCKTDEYLMDI